MQTGRENKLFFFFDYLKNTIYVKEKSKALLRNVDVLTISMTGVLQLLLSHDIAIIRVGEFPVKLKS